MQNTQHHLRVQSLTVLHDISGWLINQQIKQLQKSLENYKYDPNQPRVPAGNPEGGQWTSGGGGSGGGLVARTPKPKLPRIEENPKKPQDADILSNILRQMGVNLPRDIILNAVEEDVHDDAPHAIDSVYPELLLPALRLVRGLYSIITGLGDALDGFSNGGDVATGSAQSPQDILNPDGKPIGRPGNRIDVREMEGGAQGAKDLYDKLSNGGKPDTPSNYPGEGTRLPNGGWVGHRQTSRSGLPTVDVDVSGVEFNKIHFPE